MDVLFRIGTLSKCHLDILIRSTCKVYECEHICVYTSSPPYLHVVIGDLVHLDLDAATLPHRVCSVRPPLGPSSDARSVKEVSCDDGHWH
jgi:hypothetical protein